MPADATRSQQPRWTGFPFTVGDADPHLDRALSSLGAILLEIAGNAPETSARSQQSEDPHETAFTERKQET